MFAVVDSGIGWTLYAQEDDVVTYLDLQKSSMFLSVNVS